MATFGERLRSLRKGENMTQAALADIVGVTKYTVSIWEQDHRKPEFNTLESLCNIFNCSLGYLLGTSDDDTPPMTMGMEDQAVWLEDDLEAMQHTARLLTRLSSSSKMIISASIAQAYKLDKQAGNLQIGYDVKMSRFEKKPKESEAEDTGSEKDTGGE